MKNTSMINEISYKKLSIINEKKTNGLSVGEVNYMIKTAMARLSIPAQFHDSTAKAANYLDGPRFWELVEKAESAGKRGYNPGKYFLACARNDYSRR